jgi:hypothetical protein
MFGVTTRLPIYVSTHLHGSPIPSPQCKQGPPLHALRAGDEGTRSPENRGTPSSWTRGPALLII